MQTQTQKQTHRQLACCWSRYLQYVGQLLQEKTRLLTCRSVVVLPYAEPERILHPSDAVHTFIATTIYLVVPGTDNTDFQATVIALGVEDKASWLVDFDGMVDGCAVDTWLWLLGDDHRLGIAWNPFMLNTGVLVTGDPAMTAKYPDVQWKSWSIHYISTSSENLWVDCTQIEKHFVLLKNAAVEVL